MNKNVLIGVAVLVVIVVLFVVFQSSGPTFEGELEQQLQSSIEQPSDSVADPESNTVESNSSSDTTDALEQDLAEIDLGDLDADFFEIDQDLNSL